MRGTAATATAPAVCEPLATRPTGTIVWGCASCRAGALPNETRLTGVSNDERDRRAALHLQPASDAGARSASRSRSCGARSRPTSQPAQPGRRTVSSTVSGSPLATLPTGSTSPPLDLHGDVRAVGSADVDARHLSGERRADDVRERLAGRAEARARPLEPRRHGQAADHDHDQPPHRSRHALAPPATPPKPRSARPALNTRFAVALRDICAGSGRGPGGLVRILSLALPIPTGGAAWRTKRRRRRRATS